MKSRLAIVVVVYLFLGLVFLGQPKHRAFSQIMPMGNGALLGWTYINGRCDGSTDGAGFSTTTIDYTGADFIVIGMAKDDHTLTSFTDNSSGANTLNALTDNQGTGTDGTRIYYINEPSSTGLSAYQLTVVGSNTFASVCSMAWKGSHLGASFDQQNTNAVGGGGTTVQPGSVTPTTSNQLIVTNIAFVSVAASAIAINSGFIKQVTIDLAASQHYGQAMAYLVQSPAAAVNPTWSSLNSSDYKPTNIATFKGR